MFIYLIVNHETGRYYVGQHKGNSLQKYLQKKLSDARHGRGGSSRLYNSMRKHPFPSSWSIHALRSDIQVKSELDECEQDFIAFLKSQDPDYGYNICRGGEGFTGPHSEESKKKTPIASKRTWQNLEFRERVIPKIKASLQTEDYKLKASLARMGHETSDATREKISKAHKEKWRDPAYRDGREGVGIFSLTKQQLSENGRKGGIIVASNHIKNKTGIFGATHEQRVEWSKKAGPIGGRIGGAVTARKPGFLAEIGRIARCKHWQIDRGKTCICGQHPAS